MNKTLIVLAAVAALTVSASAPAKSTGPHARAAVAECKAERGKSRASREAFEALYHRFGRCVREKAAEDKAQAKDALKNAAKECKAERKEDPAGFEERYGTNRNGKNAFGKCVSSKAKQRKAGYDRRDAREAKDFRNAAKECAAERKDIGRKAFADKYGTNRNKRNAFGKCVSKMARSK